MEKRVLLSFISPKLIAGADSYWKIPLLPHCMERKQHLCNLPPQPGLIAANALEPTFAGYRMDAYRRLPEVWAPAPPDIWTDLHMWRKFLRRDDMRFGTRIAITGLHFATDTRPTMSLEQRAAENKAWFERIRDPVQRDAIAREALRGLNFPG